MTRPARLRILGKTYSVAYTSGAPVDDDAQGHCHYLKLAISVREGLEPQEERSTVLHEALHAVSHAVGLDFNEDQIRRLETGLFALVTDNPQFLEYLKKKK